MQIGETRIKLLRKAIDHVKETNHVVLDPVKLDPGSIQAVVLSDASYANAAEMKSQFGFFILMIDGLGKQNNVHYGSSRCRQVTRSVMAAEVHALVHAFDHRFIIRKTLEELMGRRIEIEAFVNSRTLFNTMSKNSTTTEQRLQITVCALRKSYRKRELKKIGWMLGR